MNPKPNIQVTRGLQTQQKIYQFNLQTNSVVLLIEQINYPGLSRNYDYNSFDFIMLLII